MTMLWGGMTSWCALLCSWRQAAHLHAKLLGIDLGEGGEGEGPAVQPSREGHSPLLWVHLGVPQEVIGVGGHDDVGGLDDAAEAVEGLLPIVHQLQEAAVQLVDREHGPDALTQGLCMD